MSDAEQRELGRIAGNGDLAAAERLVAILRRGSDVSAQEVGLALILGEPRADVLEDGTIRFRSWPRVPREPFVPHYTMPGDRKWEISSVNRNAQDLRAPTTLSTNRTLYGQLVHPQGFYRGAFRSREGQTASGQPVYRRGDGSLTFLARESGGPLGANLVGRVTRICEQPDTYDVTTDQP